MFKVFIRRRQEGGSKKGRLAGRTQGGGGAREGAGRAWATEAGAGAWEQRGRDRQDAQPWGPQGLEVWPGLVLHREKELSLGRLPSRSVLPTHGQVHEGEHIELCHDGEAQEHAV